MMEMHDGKGKEIAHKVTKLKRGREKEKKNRSSRQCAD